MNYEIGTQLLIESHENTWLSAVVEEDEGNEIFISYQEGNSINEWLNKDSHRIKLMNEELPKMPCLSGVQPDINSIFSNVLNEKEISKKSTSSPRSQNVFKVKFRKEDFLTKKTQDSKLKEQKIIKDSKKSSDRESKQHSSNNVSNNEKHSTNNTSLEDPLIAESSKVESESIVEIASSSKNISNTNLLKSENFEELLEDIEAEAEICSPTKPISRSDIKQKKKRKTFFGQRRRPEKRKSLQKNSGSKNKLLVKLNPNKRKVSTLSDNLSCIDDAATSTPSKKLKPSLPSSSPAENSPSFLQIANNTILQQIRMDSSNEQGFRCPKQECRKLFRKENLLMMHIKHYHSEYTEFLVSTPNVTDLATARIEGENVDELSPSYFLHRISQLEAKRSLGNSPSPNTLPSSLKFNTEQEPESITSHQSENYNTSVASIEKSNNVTQSYESKDSGFSGIVESSSSIIDTPVHKESAQIKDPPIQSISLVEDLENETKDSYDATSTVGSDRRFKIKKNKSDIESLPKEEVINCSCGSNQEDGLMIQCDVCLCWQHGFCNKIDSEDQVPDNYVCSSCLNPSKKRRSKQYEYLQDWIKEGKVPSVLLHKDERRRKDENILKSSHQLVAEVIEHGNYLHSLLVKTAIYGQSPDHPKLYLWSEPGSDRNEESLPDKLEELLTGPVPEKPINTSECRNNLLEEIEIGFGNIEARINLFEAKTNGLEDLVNGCVENENLSDTVNMLLQDLNSIRHYVMLENKNKEPNID